MLSLDLSTIQIVKYFWYYLLVRNPLVIMQCSALSTYSIVNFILNYNLEMLQIILKNFFLTRMLLCLLYHLKKNHDCFLSFPNIKFFRYQGKLESLKTLLKAEILKSNSMEFLFSPRIPKV